MCMREQTQKSGKTSTNQSSSLLTPLAIANGLSLSGPTAHTGSFFIG